jgi:hypothetical protein
MSTVSKCAAEPTNNGCFKVALEVKALGVDEPSVQSPVIVQHLDLSIDVSKIAATDQQDNLVIHTGPAQDLAVKVVEGELDLKTEEFRIVAAAYRSCLLRTVSNVLAAFPDLVHLDVDVCGRIPAFPDVRMALGQNNMLIFQYVRDYGSGSLSTFTVQTGTHLDEWSKKPVLVPAGPRKKGKKQMMVAVMEWDVEDRNHLSGWVENNEYDLWKVRDTVREKMRTPASSSQEEEHMKEEQGKEEEQAEFTTDRKDSGPDAMEMVSG